MAKITDLPQSILIDLFSYIDSVRDSNDLRLVCRQWNHLIMSYWSRRERLSLTRYIDSPELFIEYATANAKRHPRIKTLAIEPVNREKLPYIIETVPCHYKVIGELFLKLEKLIFYDCLMQDEALVKIAKACPRLRVLYLHSCHEIRDEGVANALIDAPQIKELEIFGCPEVGKDIAFQCRNLSSFAFEECPFDTDAWNKMSEAGGRENLQNLAFTPFKYDRLCFISSKFTNLKSLYIAEFDDEDTFDASSFCGFPLLETLCLTFGSVSNSDNLFKIISKSPAIRTLWIWNCINKEIANFIDELMGRLINKVNHLIIDDLKPEQLEKMNLRYFYNLKKVTLIGTELNSRIIQRIVDACPNLTHIDIADCVPPKDGPDIKASHGDFWLNKRSLARRPSCINIEPPFRANYKSVEDSYEGPVLELTYGTKRPVYFYRKLK